MGNSFLLIQRLLNACTLVTLADSGLRGATCLHKSLLVGAFRGARCLGCRYSESPQQGEGQWPHHCTTRYSAAVLGRLAALLPRLLFISHSKTLVFLFHVFSKTSSSRVFHALGRFSFLKISVEVVLVLMRTRQRVNNVLVSKAKKGYVTFSWGSSSALELCSRESGFGTRAVSDVFFGLLGKIHLCFAKL